MATKVKKSQKGFSLVELLIVFLIIGLIAAIAIPNLLAARRAANEGTAISTLRALHGAQSVYQSSKGSGNYAGTNSSTGDTVGLGILNLSELADPAIALGSKSGYSFVGAITIAGSGAPATFFFSANPAVSTGFLKSGIRRYCITQIGFIGFDVANLSTPYDATTALTATPVNP